MKMTVKQREVMERLLVVYCNGKNLNEELIKSGNGYLVLEFCSKSEFSNDMWAQDNGC